MIFLPNDMILQTQLEFARHTNSYCKMQ